MPVLTDDTAAEAAAAGSADRLRVALVAWSFYPRMGGSVTTTMTLARELAARGLKVDIIAPVLAKDLAKTEGFGLGGGIDIHWAVSSAAGSYDTFRGRLVFLAKMTAAVRKLSPSVQVFHAQDFNVGLISALLGTKKPVAAYFGADPLLEALYYKKKEYPARQGLEKTEAAALLRGLARIALSLLAGKRLTVITYNAPSDREAEKYWRGPRTMMPVGVDTRSAEAAPEREQLLFFAARLVCWKGFDDAARFYRAAREKDPSLKMICAGEGPLRGYYEKKYAGEGIHFAGGLSCGEMAGYYARARLLIAPSRYETFGLTVSEAMAAGLPIAATDLEAYKDRLNSGENCLLLKDWDEKGLAEATALLRDDERLKRYAAAARNSIKAQDISLVGGLCADLYRGLAADGAGKSRD